MGGVAGGRKRLFAKELRCMMFGFGDDHNPYTESVDMLEDIVLEFIIQMVRPQPLRALSTLRGLRGAPAVSPLCRETQSLGQQMLGGHEWVNKLLHRECGHAGGYCAGIHRADGEKMKYICITILRIQKCTLMIQQKQFYLKIKDHNLYTVESVDMLEDIVLEFIVQMVRK